MKTRATTKRMRIVGRRRDDGDYDDDVGGRTRPLRRRCFSRRTRRIEDRVGEAAMSAPTTDDDDGIGRMVVKRGGRRGGGEATSLGHSSLPFLRHPPMNSTSCGFGSTMTKRKTPMTSRCCCSLGHFRRRLHADSVYGCVFGCCLSSSMAGDQPSSISINYYYLELEQIYLLISIFRSLPIYRFQLMDI